MTIHNGAESEEGRDMTKRVRTWIVLAVLVGAVLGGAYVVVARNNPALSVSAGAPTSGVFH